MAAITTFFSTLKFPQGENLLTQHVFQNAEPEVAPLRRGERRKLHTKRRLIDAAAEIYSTHGIDGATISSITERADVGLGTFYLHFEDKEAIAVNVCSLVVRRIFEEEQTALDAVRSVGGTPDPLAILARVICGRAADSPGMIRALLRWEGPSAPRPGSENDFVALRHSLLPAIAERFSEGQARGIYRTEDPTLAANALFGVFATTIPTFVDEGRSDWNTLASFVERATVAMFRC